VNKHGLARKPPADVRRQLRREAGFGCIVCGFVFCHYEHIDPEFADATHHDPLRMAFLCGRCHVEVTARRKSKDSVWTAKQNPYCLRKGHSWGDLEFGANQCRFGSMEFTDCRVLLRINDVDLATVELPEEPGGPARISAKFYDGDALVFQIEENGIVLNRDSWDVDTVGPLLTIRRGLRDRFLIYRFTPRHGLSVELLDMSYQGVQVRVTGERVIVGDGTWGIEAVAASFFNCQTCIVASEHAIRFGDELTVQALANPLCRSISFEFCNYEGGVWISEGAQVKLQGCRIGRGVLIDKGAGLSEVRGTLVVGCAIRN
jgi:hypothetical protein